MVATHLSPDWGNPQIMGVFEIIGTLVWVGMAIYFIRDSIRTRTLTTGLLLHISITSMFWLEFYGDWGVYLLYNPKLALIPWGITKWTTPNKPWCVIPAYSWFYTPEFLAGPWLAKKFYARFPKLGLTGAVFIGAGFCFWVWDVCIEVLSTSLGWWSYTYFVGPGVVSDRGNYPLVHPVVWLSLYTAATTWFLVQRGPDGHVKFESWFGVERIRNSVSRGLAQIGVWCLMMNVFYAGFFIVWMVAVRELTIRVQSTVVP